MSLAGTSNRERNQRAQTEPNTATAPKADTAPTNCRRARTWVSGLGVPRAAVRNITIADTATPTPTMVGRRSAACAPGRLSTAAQPITVMRPVRIVLVAYLWVKYVAPTSAPSAVTMNNVVPTSTGLSLVPKVEIAQSLNHVGARSMTSWPTAITGATPLSLNDAISSETASPTAVATTPAMAPRRFAS